MTIPYERYRAVLMTEKFLCSLLDPKKTPKVPKAIREEAARCLRHYPGSYHMEEVADKSPEVFEASNPFQQYVKESIKDE